MSVHSDTPIPEEPYVAGEQGTEESDAGMLYDESEQEASAPSPAGENGPEPTETRRGMRRYRRGDVQIEEGDDEEGETLVVSIRLHAGGKRRTYEVEEPETRSKIKRLSSKANATAAVASSTPGGAAAAPDASAPRGAPLMKLTPRTAPGAMGRESWNFDSAAAKRPLILGAILLALIAAYVFGKRSSGPANTVRTPAGRLIAPPVAKLTPVWSPAMIAQLDAALTADAAGDLKTARSLATELKKKYPDSPALTLYLSTLQTRGGDYNDAEVDVSKLLDPFAPPLQSASVSSHLGFIYARHRDFPRAVEAFANAAAADPFNADHFQQWAEALRRSGQLQEAIDHFKQALTRLPDGRPGVAEQREDIDFKVRLSQIEAGKDDELKAAIDSHLQGAAPIGYWLLTAAAYALQHGDMSAAQDALRRARQAMSKDDYAALTNDYFFHAYSIRKEMEGLLPPDTPEARTLPFMPRMGYYIDP